MEKPYRTGEPVRGSTAGPAGRALLCHEQAEGPPPDVVRLRPAVDPHPHLGQRQAERADPLDDVLRDLYRRPYARRPARR
ncbi:MAG: hypothetical protein ABSB76_21115 [Streptosporangiaceae bacterium]